MCQHYSTHHDCDYTRHIEKLSHDVAQYSKNVGEGYLSDLIFHQKATFLENK